MRNKFTKEHFKDFTIYKSENNHLFLHVDLQDNIVFYEKIFDFFFSESNFLNYIENKSMLKFNPTEENYVILYKGLDQLIDDEIISIDEEDFEQEILSVFSEEYDLDNKNCDGKLSIRKDKIGKFGEFMFCTILKEYYGFSCIIPKINLTTNKNMSIYGIDSLFYVPDKKAIAFGESKVSKNLENALKLANESLKVYKQQIDNEFKLVISNRLYKDKMGIFGEEFSDVIDTCISMERFIDKANIKNFIIPVFMAHGREVDPEEILKSLKRIKIPQLYKNIDVTLMSISVPVINKSKLTSIFTKKIRERMIFYESKTT